MEKIEDFNIEFKAKVRRGNFWSNRYVKISNNFLTYFKNEKMDQVRIKMNLQKHTIEITTFKRQSMMCIKDKQGNLVVNILLPPEVEDDIKNGLNIHLQQKIILKQNDLTEQNTKAAEKDRETDFILGPNDNRSSGNTVSLKRKTGAVLGNILEDELVSSDEEDFGFPEPSKSQVTHEYLAMMDLISQNKLLVDIKEGMYIYKMGLAENKVPLNSVLKLSDLATHSREVFEANKAKFFIVSGITLLSLFVSFTKLQTMTIVLVLSSLIWYFTSTLKSMFGGGAILIEKSIDLSIRDNRILEANFSGADFLEDHVDDKYLYNVISMASISLNKFFVIYKSLFLLVLKSQLRKEITPLIRAIDFSKKRYTVTNEIGATNVMEQFTVNKGRDTISLIEVDAATRSVASIYQMSLKKHSRSIEFQVFKQEGNSEIARVEMLGLIDHIRRLTKDLNIVKNAIQEAFYQQIEFIPTSFQSKALVQETEPVFASQKIEKQSVGPQVLSRELPSNRGSVGPNRNSTNAQSHVRDEPLLDQDFLEAGGITDQEFEAALEIEMNDGRTRSAQISAEEVALTQQTPVKEPEIPDSLPEVMKQQYYLKKKEAFAEMDPENNPDLKLESNKDGVKIHIGNNGKRLMTRGEMVIDFDFDYAVEKASDVKFRVEFDPVLKDIIIVKQYTERVGLVQIRVKGKFPVSDRSLPSYIYGAQLDKDVSTLSSILTYKTFMGLNFTPSDQKLEALKGTVQGTIFVAITLLKRVGPSKTKIIAYSASDPSLSGVPMGLVKANSKDAAKYPYFFNEALKKIESKNKKNK